MAVTPPGPSNVPGVACSNNPATSETNASPRAPFSTTVSPGRVQNCPAPIETESCSSLAIAAERSSIAPGSTNTGLTLDISR